MRLMVAVVAFLAALPVAAIVAVMAGPVALVILCGAGFGLIVFVVGNVLAAAEMFVRYTERSAARHLHLGARH